MFQHQITCNEVPPFFSANLLFRIPHEESHRRQEPHSSLPHPPLPTNPQDFTGMETILGKRSLSCEESLINLDDDVSDNGLQPDWEKKRTRFNLKRMRLNLKQVRTLERNFDMGNKLEPERKMELARALELQPRQISIWFQNRRAKCKIMQLEKDYDELKNQFETIKAKNNALQSQNKKLLSELLALKGKEETSEPINLNKETECSCSIRSENSSDINLDMSREPINDGSSEILHQSINFFPTYRASSVSQLLHSSSKSGTPKVENSIQGAVNLFNMFCTTDDQSAF